MNGRRLTPGERVRLTQGDEVRFGQTRYSFLVPFSIGDRNRQSGVERYSLLASRLTSLDPGEIVARGLELVRLVSGVERSYLVAAGKNLHIDPLLTPLDDPELRVSQSSIEQAISKNETVALFLTEGDSNYTASMRDFGLHRIWVRPVAGHDGHPVAAVYLDSPNVGSPFTPEVEAALEIVCDHIGMALRNAMLYAQVVDLNQTLERRVEERTRQLETSQAQLVSQDRLATLGRLVAAIAHELNNPAGAIASFAGTLRGLVEPVRSMQSEVETLFPDGTERGRVEALLDAAIAAARLVPPDSRMRRELEDGHSRWLAQARVPAAEIVAQRFARIGFARSTLEPAIDLLRSHGDRISALAGTLFTFGRSLETIGECAGTIARIVDGLKTYAHLDRSQAEILDVHRSIQTTLSVLGTRIPPGIEVVTRFASIPEFAHRPGELSQVWTNLVDNAARAMGETGTLTIETYDDGPEVRVTVTDTGSGIPKEIAERIFELHVTTRGPGAGLGLGLPICRTIVEKNHGGRLSFESRPGNTVFTVVLGKSLS